MKCFNCPDSALYVVADPGVSAIYYCYKCLPAFLKPRAEAGQLDIPTQTPKKKKKAETAVEETSETTDESNED
jgi:hypothetical protein